MTPSTTAGILLALVAWTSPITPLANATDTKLTPVEARTALGTWEGLSTGESGEVRIVRISLRDAKPQATICDFFGLAEDAPQCWSFDLGDQSIRRGRLRLRGKSTRAADPWRGVLIDGRGTANEGFGSIEVTVALVENAGGRGPSWKATLYRREKGMLAYLQSIIERFLRLNDEAESLEPGSPGQKPTEK
jgi:hypothetical protein